MPCSDCSPAFTALKRLKQCQLLPKLRANQHPFASERAELTEIVSDAEKEISKYSDRIAWLHDQIVALENEQKRLKRQISLAESLMAPIRQFPPEVLRQIFLQHRTNIIDLHRGLGLRCVPGMILAAVCSHWRSIARATTELWNIIDITFAPYNESIDSRCATRLVENILQLSGKSYLDITINSPYFDAWDSWIVRTLSLHVDRWQSLRGHSRDVHAGFLDVLRDLRGRVNHLHTFSFHSSQDLLSMLEGAPKLHTLALSVYDSQQDTPLPFEQIRHLTIENSAYYSVMQSLRRASNLEILELHNNDHNEHNDFFHLLDNEPLVHSKITSLHITISSHYSEGCLDLLLLRLTLPSLSSLTIDLEDESGYITNRSEDNCHWSDISLPEFISRSSAPITTFTLRQIWMPTNDLISLLQSMPTLTAFELWDGQPQDDGSDDHRDGVDPMITNDLLSALNCHQIGQQPMLTRLTSLSLTIYGPVSFSYILFRDVIRSRWNPSESLVDKDDESEVACIKTVKLRILHDTIAWSLVQPLMIFRKRGLDISFEDDDGYLGLMEDE